MRDQIKTTIAEFKKSHSDKAFSHRDALSFGLSKRQFYELIKNGDFERVDHGCYRLRESNSLGLDVQFRDLSKVIRGKSAICLISALSYYGLSDEIVTTPWFIVEQSTVSSLSSVRLFRKRNPQWDIGIVEKDGFLITSIERTIIECLAYKKTVTGYEGVYALRKAVRKKMVRIENIFKMAEALGYAQRVMGSLESYLDEGA